jgi:hypothetical protein
MNFAAENTVSRVGQSTEFDGGNFLLVLGQKTKVI